MRTRALGTFVSLILLTASASVAGVIVVSPGPGTPLQDAISSAPPKSTIQLHAGVYSEALVIDRQLTFKVSNDGPVVIDATGTGAAVAVEVTADRVSFRGKRRIGSPTDSPITIGGGTTLGLLVAQRNGFKIQDADVQNMWIDGSTNVSMTFVSMYSGTSMPYGLKISSVPLGGKINIKYLGINNAAPNDPDTGILVENCTKGGLLGKGGIKLGVNNIYATTTAIAFVNSDGVSVQGRGGSYVHGNTQTHVRPQITLDNNSKNNFFTKIVDAQVFDFGAGNCGRNAAVFNLSECS